MRVRTKIVTAIALAASLATAATAFSAHVSASMPRDSIDIASFGMTGVAAGQRARLNVVLAQPLPEGQQYPPGPPVRVQLSLMDAMGNLALPSSCAQGQVDCLAGSQLSVSLTPGQSTFLDVSGDQLVGASGRAEIRAVARVFPPGPPTIPANLIATLEIIDDATNATVVLYHPPSPCRGDDCRGNDWSGR